MDDKYTIKVTKIKDRWHARLFRDTNLVDEMACQCRQDIAYICKTMLRWQCKTGSTDNFAMAARKRLVSTNTIGTVWWGLHNNISDRCYI